MLAQPVAEVELVERLEVTGRSEEVVAQDADQADGVELEDDPQAPQVGVGLEVARGQGPEPVEQGPDAVGDGARCLADEQ